MTKRFLTLCIPAFILCAGILLIQSCKKDHETNTSLPDDPHIDSFAPTSAAKDSIVVINGTNFSPTTTENLVKFNGAVANIIAATATSLTVRVPVRTGNGKITVQKAGRMASSANDFIYLYTVSTLAGDGVAGFKEGMGSDAEFKFPFGIAVDASGTIIYVGDGGNNRVRKVTAQGLVSTLAGNGATGFANGPALTDAKFNDPEGVAVDANGNVYVADFGNYLIRKISAGEVSTLAGDGTLGFKDGASAIAQFFDPQGIAVDISGNVFVSEFGNNRVRKISAGIVSTVAGNGTGGYHDGASMNAQFDSPEGIAVDPSGNIYVGDFRNNRVRKITGSTVSTLAGDGTASFRDGAGTTAQFNHLFGVAADALGNVYVADRANHRIRKITAAGIVSTIAGNGNPGLKDGAGPIAQFNFPSNIAVDANGVLYVTDELNNSIRKLE